MQRLSPILIACLLAGCSASGNINSQPPCTGPAALPDHALSDQQVEIYWGRDRRSLIECYWRNEVASGRNGPS